MLIVVFQHVRAFSFGLYANDSVLSEVYLTFMLPMFFVISGFSLYRNNWRDSISISRWIDKGRQLLIPTIAFLLLHNYIPNHQGIWGFPGGYWFTYSLFWIITVYMTIAWCFSNCSDKTLISVLIILSVILVGIRGVLGVQLDSGWMSIITLRKTLTYFIFFVLGVIMKYFENELDKYLNSYKNIIIVFTLLCFLAEISLKHILPDAMYSLYEIVLSTTACIALFLVFYLNKSLFNNNHQASITLCFIGRRTLDLYMLHYFFLPNLADYGGLFDSSGNCVIELLVVGIITILVSAISLGLGQFIRLSHTSAYLLLGSKQSSK